MIKKTTKKKQTNKQKTHTHTHTHTNKQTNKQTNKSQVFEIAGFELKVTVHKILWTYVHSCDPLRGYSYPKSHYDQHFLEK